MSYYLKLMEGGPLPVELCERILEFADEEVPIVSSRASTPVGWFYYTARVKMISEIRHKSELDLCKKCDNWDSNCTCQVNDLTNDLS